MKDYSDIYNSLDPQLKKHLQEIRKIGGTKLKCQRCGYIWIYRGKNEHVAVCSHCKTSVMIKKNAVRE